jgi:hypothetical protein
LFRYDGSQIFPEGKRYGFFPAVSAGWRLSEESFIKDNLPFVNELKLRGSYGELGNDRVPAYQYLQAFQFGHNYQRRRAFLQHNAKSEYYLKSAQLDFD